MNVKELLEKVNKLNEDGYGDFLVHVMVRSDDHPGGYSPASIKDISAFEFGGWVTTVALIPHLDLKIVK